MSDTTGLRVVPSGTGLAATVEGLDLSGPLGDAQHRAVLDAIAAHGVLRFPAQSIDSRQLFDFSARFGTPEVNVGGIFQEPGLPQVMILSNIVRDGKPIGIGDAGQDWHTDMSYSGTVAFANVLYALEVPHPLGLITVCAAGEGQGELVLERRGWRQLVAALFDQHGDAGASQPRSHAGAWERSIHARDGGWRGAGS